MPTLTNFPVNQENIENYCKTIHSTFVNDYKFNREHNKILKDIAPSIHKSEETLPRKIQCTLSQLRTGKSPFLLSYLHDINSKTYPSPICPACNLLPHDVEHLFKCNNFPTSLTVRDLWENPVGVADLLVRWGSTLPQLQNW